VRDHDSSVLPRMSALMAAMVAPDETPTRWRLEKGGKSRNSECQGGSTGPLEQAGLYGAAQARPISRPPTFPAPLPRERRRRWRRAPRLGSWRERTGIAEGTFVRYPAAANGGHGGRSLAVASASAIAIGKGAPDPPG
jgi:hypothetical protein